MPSAVSVFLTAQRAKELMQEVRRAYSADDFLHDAHNAIAKAVGEGHDSVELEVPYWAEDSVYADVVREVAPVLEHLGYDVRFGATSAPRMLVGWGSA